MPNMHSHKGQNVGLFLAPQVRQTLLGWSSLPCPSFFEVSSIFLDSQLTPNCHFMNGTKIGKQDSELANLLHVPRGHREKRGCLILCALTGNYFL